MMSQSESLSGNQLEPRRPSGKPFRPGFLSRSTRGLFGSIQSLQDGQVLDPEEVKLGFRFLDSRGRGKVSLNELRQRLKSLLPWEPMMTKEEAKELTGGKKYLSLEDLQQLLSKSVKEDEHVGDCNYASAH